MAEVGRQVATLAVLVSQHAVEWPIATFSAIMLRISNIRKDIRSGVRVALRIYLTVLKYRLVLIFAGGTVHSVEFVTKKPVQIG